MTALLLAHLGSTVAAAWLAVGISGLLGMILGAWLTTSALADHRARAERLLSALTILARAADAAGETRSATAARNIITHERNDR